MTLTHRVIPPPIPANLRTASFFPALSHCPSDDLISEQYYSSHDGTYYKPRQHWSLLAEIRGVEYYGGPRVYCRDVSGWDFLVAFGLENFAQELDLERLKIGNTVVVLYPNKHDFGDGDMGVRMEVASFVKAFPVGLEELLRLSDRVQDQTAMVEGKRACHACGKRSEKLLMCAKCGFCWYCDKGCQKIGWHEKRHKKDCKLLQDEDLRAVFTLDWANFITFMRFSSKCSDFAVTA